MDRISVSPPRSTPHSRLWFGGRLYDSSGESFCKKLCLIVDFFVAVGYAVNTMAVQYQRDEHRVHLIVYHLIFCPKRRKSVLVGGVEKECERLITQKCEQNGWQALKLAIHPDHVYLRIRVFPTNAAADVVKAIKACTSHELRLKFPDLKRRLPSLWTRSYFASTAEDISEDTIRDYIHAQKGA